MSRWGPVVSWMVSLSGILILASAAWTAYVVTNANRSPAARERPYQVNDLVAEVQDVGATVPAMRLVVVTRDSCELCREGTGWFKQAIENAGVEAQVVLLQAAGSTAAPETYGLAAGVSTRLVERISMRIPKFPSILLVDRTNRLVAAQFGRDFPDRESAFLAVLRENAKGGNR